VASMNCYAAGSSTGSGGETLCRGKTVPWENCAAAGGARRSPLITPLVADRRAIRKVHVMPDRPMLVRDPRTGSAQRLADRGVEVVAGSLNNEESLAAAMRAVAGVFAMTTPFEDGVRAEVEQGRTILHAAHPEISWTRFGTWATDTFGATP
jgi:hypothetical protein